MHISADMMLEIQKDVDDGYISVRQHPTIQGLSIYNYTKKTQFEGHWTQATRMCRGLVLDDNLRVVIKCPEKFFNAGEPGAPDVTTWSIEYTFATEKLDGYYISFRNDSQYGLVVTSRGSFDNQYVEAAKKLMPPLPDIIPDTDYFCELCQNFAGDESTIVASHPEPRLVLWGINDELPNPFTYYHMEVAKRIYNVEKYLEGLVEGVVVYNSVYRQRAKVKTEWYINMHRIISGISHKRVLTALADGESLLTDENIPEEHLKQISEWEAEYLNEYNSLITHAAHVFETTKELSDKEFAVTNQEASEIRSLVFAMRKGQDANVLARNLVKRKLLRNATDE